METITPQQLNTLHSIVSEARQTIDGDSPIRSIDLCQHETGIALDVTTWRTHNAKDEGIMHRAVMGLEKHIISKDLPCTIYLYTGDSTEGLTHTCNYAIKP